ncbi:leucine-rich repeat protein [Aquimarina sp. M1]
MKTRLLIIFTVLITTVSFSQTFTIDNLNYEVIDPNLNTVSVIGGSNLPNDLVIPETVIDPATSISYTVTTIGREAFRNKGLTSVTLPPTLTTLEFRAFRDNRGINSITIPANVISIGNESFFNNSLILVISENSIPPSIAGGTFGDRSQISLFVPLGTEIDYSNASWTGFSQVNGQLPVNSSFIVNNLNYKITSSNPNTVEVIGGSVTGELIIPDSVVAPDGFSYTITSVGNRAFENQGITGLSIPNTVTEIKSLAFHENQITETTLPNSVTSIGFRAFRFNQLSNINIPDSVTSIGNGAFEGNQLINVAIPEGVTTIEQHSFRSNQLQTVIIPSTVTSIGNSAFRNNQLTIITLPGNILSIESFAFRENPSLESIVSEASVPPVIAGDAFENRNTIDLFIPDNTAGAYESGGWTGFRSINGFFPTLLCQDITVPLGADGGVTIIESEINLEFENNAPTNAAVFSQDIFDCSNVGDNEITLTVTNVLGNSSSCTVIVTVEDRINPTVECRDITIQLDSNDQVSISVADIEFESFDNCNIDNKNISKESFGIADIGENEVILTITDQVGNSSSCIALVTVVANDFPVANCKDITVQLDATGQTKITSADIEAGSTDTVGIASITVSPETFDCSNLGDNEVTLTVTNTRGNSSTCTAIVTVEDTTAPTITCPADVIQDCAGFITYPLPDFSEDICGFLDVPTTVDGFSLLGNFGNSTYFISNVPISGTQAFAEVQQNGYEIITINNKEENDFIRAQVSALGVQNVLIGYNDLTTEGVFEWQSGQPATFTNFNQGEPNGDNGQDMVVLISNTGLWNDIPREDSRPYIIEYHDYTSGEPILISGIPSGGFFAGTTVNTFYVEDKAGNSTTCSFNVTINDVTGPSLTCNENIVVEAESDTCEANVIVPIPTFNDDCGGILIPDTFNVSYIFSTSSEELEDTPSTLQNVIQSDKDVLLELTFSGDHDNSSENFVLLGPDNTIIFDETNFSPVCVVTVKNIRVPQNTWNSWVTTFGNNLDFILQNNSVVDKDQCDDGNENFYRLRLPEFGNISLSNDFTQTRDASAFYPVGTTTVTWTAKDKSGNSATCTQTITVNDTEVPNAVCQDITARLDDTGQVIITAEDIDAGSTDNCSINSISVTPDTFTSDNLGDNEVTLTVVDQSGNEATCTAILTVIDDDFPVAVCQNITIQLDENGTASITAQDVDGGSSDATGIDTLTISQSSFDCSDIGENTVTLTVTNTLGNSLSCEAIVIVEDSIAPVITCPADIMVSNEANLCETEIVIPLLTDIIDNCGTAIIPDTGVVSYLFDEEDNLQDTSSTLVGVSTTTEDVVLKLNFSGDHNSSSEVFTLAGPDNSILFSDSDIDPVCITTEEFILIPQATWNDWITNFGSDLSFTLQKNIQVDNDQCDSNSVNFYRLRLPQFGDVSVINDYTGTIDASGIYPTGTTEVTWTVEDISGNSTSCIQRVILEAETIAPEAICKDLIVQLDENDTITITAADVDNGSTDNCSVATIEVTPNTFGLTEIGENTVVLTVTDQSGNVATCSSIVTVVPNDFVEAVCKDITISLDQNGQATIAGQDVFGGSIDSSNTAVFDVVPNSFDSSNIGINSVILTVTNTDGSTSTCNATVTVIDAAAPTVVCQDITVQLNANGQVVVQASEIDGGSSDVFGIASLSIGSAVVEPATLPGLYALDPFSTINLARYEYDPVTDAITIADNPYGETSLETTVSMDFNPIDGQVYLIADSPTTANRALFFYDLGTNTLVSELGDINAANGNSKANSMVFAPDGTLYVSFGNGDINILNINTMTTTALASAPKNGGGIGLGYDNDTERLIYTSLNEDESAVDIYEIDTTSGDVILLFSFIQGITGCEGTAQALEYVGNGKFVASTTQGCSEIYTIDINTQSVAPLLSPDRFNGDIKALLYVSGKESSTPGASIIFDCTDIGVNEVALAVTDSNGNTASCFTTVTVEDISAPQITCPAAQSVATDEGSTSYTLPDYFATGETLATGTCANPLVTFTQDPAPGTLLSEGTTLVTLCAADALGDKVCCSFELTIDPTLSIDDLELFGSISMYPNPANNIVHISNPSEVILNSITIYDVNGRLIISDQNSISDSDISINISRLESGPYFVIIKGTQANVTKQLIKK